MGIRRTEGGFEGVRGVHLFRRSWISEHPERVLLVVHGFAEHSGRYDHLGCWFAERGAAVHAYDLRGHGRSQGTRNDVLRFDDFLDDVAALQEIVGREHPGLPITVVGHSMGGLIATAYVRERKPAIESLVTSGAALEVGEAMRGPRALLLRVLARLAPGIHLPAGLPADALSRDPEVVRDYEADPLVDTRLTPRLAVAMLGAIQRTAAGGGEIEVPMLLLHGGDDRLCPPSGSRAFFDSLQPGAAPPSEIRIYPGLRHEIFNEPEQESIFEDVRSWLEGLEGTARASGADPGASSAGAP